MQFVSLLFVLHTSCAKQSQSISLEKLLPQQISSVPIGIAINDFQSKHSEEYEVISLGENITYLKKTIRSPEVLFVQYKFQDEILKEVLIGYKASFGAKDIATSLYGPPNDSGRWLATSDEISVTIEIFDNTLIYR
jgi:hypothetical protein